MGSKRVDISSFNYKRFEPQVRPSFKKLSNYNSMHSELFVQENGYVRNPFSENSKRFILFEALRRNIDLNQITEELKLNEDQIALVRRTYLQIKKCYFPG